MLTYEVRSTREDSVTVDGLGVLSPGESRVLSADALESFVHVRGLMPNRVNLPEGVYVSVTVSASDEKVK